MLAFDLLLHDGRDMRKLPLVECKDILIVLVMGPATPRLRLSDGVKLLAAAKRTALEGVVSKRRDAAYRSGPRCGWVKTKTKAWREANKGAVAALRAALTGSADKGSSTAESRRNCCVEANSPFVPIPIQHRRGFHYLA